MHWFNIIKVDREERIRGILSNWLDEVLDWLEIVESEAVDLKNNLESNFDELHEMINTQPEHLRESLREMFPMSREEVTQLIQETMDELDSLKPILRQQQTLVDDMPILRVLNAWQEAQLIEPILALGEGLESNPPTPPNLDRFIGQLELGEGYEE